jgi:UDP-N-acetylglucosamine transferase subunit ALG13
MIFVTVGMFPKQFVRLVRAADEMAGQVDEYVVIQRGATAYVPSHAHSFTYDSEDSFVRWVAQARVVVAHAGAGTILGVLRAGKPLVVVPRLERLQEHNNDHQLELAQVLAEQNRATSLVQVSAQILLEAVENAAGLQGGMVASPGLHSAVRDWLDEQAVTHIPRWSCLLGRGHQGG